MRKKSEFGFMIFQAPEYLPLRHAGLRTHPLEFLPGPDFLVAESRFLFSKGDSCLEFSAGFVPSAGSSKSSAEGEMRPRIVPGQINRLPAFGDRGVDLIHSEKISGSVSMADRGCQRYLKTPSINICSTSDKGDRLGLGDRHIFVTAAGRQFPNAQKHGPFDHGRQRFDEVAAGHYPNYSGRHRAARLYGTNHLRTHAECCDPAIVYAFTGDVFANEFHGLTRLGAGIDK